MLPQMGRWHTPAEALKMATADSVELLVLSSPRSPYSGKLGVAQAGALPDPPLVRGAPIASIYPIDEPTRNFLVIMKDGQIHKSVPW